MTQKKGSGRIIKLVKRICLVCFPSQWMFIFTRLPQRELGQMVK